MIRWSLECILGEGGQMERLPLREFPLILGRSEEAGVTFNSTDVSRQHAELALKDNALWLQDMGSTNGTFVNHQRISGPVSVRGGDVIHFAHVEARLIDEAKTTGVVSAATIVMGGDLSSKIPLGARDFKSLLEHEQVTPVYQPIVNVEGKHLGYEMLGRGTHPALLPSPGSLFTIAESIGKAVELSELFRETGMREADRQGLALPLFLNTHPNEMQDQARLLSSLKKARQRYAGLELVIEIHEQCVTDISEMKSLSTAIKAMEMGLAYDDFGAGQARLLELTEATPEVVKFDIALIRNIHKAGMQKQEMLELLVSMVKKMGIKALAEGVSSMAEAAVCRRIGFDLIQGFAYGYPLPLTEWTDQGARN